MSAQFRFAVNLRADTTTPQFVAALRPWGWLGAPDNLTAGTRGFAADAVRRGRTFVADNGNFAAIGRLAAPYREEASALRQRVTDLESTTGRTAGRADLDPALAAAYDDLARRVRRSARAQPAADAERLAVQRGLGASLVIGAEDLTAALLLLLDAEPHLLGTWPRARWRAVNRGVARRAVRLLDDVPAARPSYYTVASAVDWASAYDAGREFAAAGLERVAMGFGAYMADNHSTDVLRLGRRVVRLPTRMPQRYLRTAVVVSAFLAGYCEEAGRAPSAFHFLGLGAPIMMGVVAVAAAEVQLVSFDAVSPVKDAVEGTLYTVRPAFLRLRARAIADRITRGGPAWDCPCAFCRRFRDAYPSDEAAAVAWRAATSGPVGAVPLRPGGGLYDALPLLAEPAAGAQRRAVSAARMGHNHWVLVRACDRLTRRAARGMLENYVGEVVAAYRRATASPRFAEAVRVGFDIARGHLR